jgi:hypothetical protein
VPQFVNRERFSRIRVNDAVAFHLEPFGWKIFEVRRMGEVHKDLVIKLSNVIDSFIERNMKNLSSAHCVVQSDANEKSSFADAVTRNNDADVAGAKPTMDRVFKQS